MNILLVEAQLKRFSRVKDGAVDLTFRTARELSGQDFSHIDDYYQQNGHLAFKTDEIDISEIPTHNTKIKGQVSPSEYLRTRLFAKHMAKGGTKETFPPYYERAVYGFAEAVDNSYTRD